MALKFKPNKQMHATAMTLVTAFAISCMVSATYVQSYNSVQQQPGNNAIIARRAADQSRPLTRVNRNLRSHSGKPASEIEAPIIQGRFKAPSPQQFQINKFSRNSDFSSQTLGASMQVSDTNTPTKVVNGILGSSSPIQSSLNNDKPQRNNKIERNVGATIQVSDEGLNYPPSKLSADIYGNVAEIITAPPSQVDVDFLIPQLDRLYTKPN